MKYKTYKFRITRGNSEYGQIHEIKARTDAEATALLRRKILSHYTIIDITKEPGKLISIQL